jgi:hypothetical protein
MQPFDSPRFRELDLIRLLHQIIQRQHPETVIEIDSVVGDDLRVDLLYTIDSVLYVVDVRGNPPQTLSRLDELLTKLMAYRDAAVRKYRNTNAVTVLAIPTELTEEKGSLLRSANIELWDKSWILDAAEAVGLGEQAAELLGHRAAPRPDPIRQRRLQDKLRFVQPGKPAWSQYQKLCRDIFEHLFCPPLSKPIEESSNESKVNRRDFVMPNYVTEGFWFFLRTHYQADYLVVDAKNLTGLVGKNHVLQLCNYMSSHGTGLFGIIATRKGSNRAADFTRREQWVLHRKMVVVLGDDDLMQMLNNKDSGDDPGIVIRQKIEDFRLGI